VPDAPMETPLVVGWPELVMVVMISCLLHSRPVNPVNVGPCKGPFV
jgi:hypothetical protein